MTFNTECTFHNNVRVNDDNALCIFAVFEEYTYLTTTSMLTEKLFHLAVSIPLFFNTNYHGAPDTLHSCILCTSVMIMCKSVIIK